jgi:putative oxidoreductase
MNELINQYNQHAAVLLTRIFLGLLFFFQGYDAVFRIKLKNVIETYKYDFSAKGIPIAFTVLGVWFTSVVELVGGLFMMAGLLEYYTLYLLGLNLIVASVAFGINTPLWDTRHVFPRLALIIFLLCVPRSWDTLTLDHFLFKN